MKYKLKLLSLITLIIVACGKHEDAPTVPVVETPVPVVETYTCMFDRVSTVKKCTFTHCITIEYNNYICVSSVDNRACVAQVATNGSTKDQTCGSNFDWSVLND